MLEPNVSREEIRELARAAAERGQPMTEANPYEEGTHAHHRFELDYREHERHLQDETVP